MATRTAKRPPEGPQQGTSGVATSRDTTPRENSDAVKDKRPAPLDSLRRQADEKHTYPGRDARKSEDPSRPNG